MGNFFSFDLNRDGLISLEEVMMEGTGNGTVHTAPEWCQPAKFATLSFSAFLVICDQDKSVHVGQQILNGGNFCLPTSLLLRDYISLSILKCIMESCPARV